MKEFNVGELYKIKNKIYRFKECTLSKCSCVPYYFWSFESVDNGEIISVTSVPLNNYVVVLDDAIKLSEKEVLEIQLKEAEEQAQKETARVDTIKAKLEELSKPKLKVGGLYKFEKFDNDFIGVVINVDRNAGWYGVLNHRLNGIITYNIEHYKVTEITNPKYSHIGKTIMEFHNLKIGNV